MSGQHFFTDVQKLRLMYSCFTVALHRGNLIFIYAMSFLIYTPKNKAADKAAQ